MQTWQLEVCFEETHKHKKIRYKSKTATRETEDSGHGDVPVLSDDSKTGHGTDSFFKNSKSSGVRALQLYKKSMQKTKEDHVFANCTFLLLYLRLAHTSDQTPLSQGKFKANTKNNINDAVVHNERCDVIHFHLAKG